MQGELIVISQPKLDADKIGHAYKSYLAHGTMLQLDELFLRTETPVYLHWNQLKYKSWIPKHITPEDFWCLLKVLKRQTGYATPITDTKGQPFKWNKAEHFDQILHVIDLRMGGRLLDHDQFTPEDKKRIISRGLIEEAIASAQMEGAHTTRDAAKKMIKEGRHPIDRGQYMIMNNYKVMLQIEESAKDEKLTLDVILDLHATLTNHTLDVPAQAGRFRTDEEKIVVASDIDGQIGYIPPPIAFVRSEMDKLIVFANDEDGKFVHPVIKAIMLHFWIGFLHPFADGNGRLARALFYWYLLRKGYWAFAYLPLSTMIKRSAGQYSKAYIYTEQDDNDLTYFIDYNLRKIVQSQKDFEKYIREEFFKHTTETQILKKYPDLNGRQVKIFQYFKAKPDERTNMTSMIHIYGISEATAVSDLKKMEKMGLLAKQKSGLNVFYYPTAKLLEG